MRTRTYWSPLPPLRWRNSVAWQAEGAPAAGLGRDLHRDLAPERRDLHLGAEGRFPHGDRQLDVEIILAALEDRMRGDVNPEVEVPARAAADAGATLAGRADARAVPDTGGDLHFHAVAPRQAPGAAARGTRRLALAARAAAGGAHLQLLELHRPPGARLGFLEADLDLGLEVAAPPPARAASPERPARPRTRRPRTGRDARRGRRRSCGRTPRSHRGRPTGRRARGSRQDPGPPAGRRTRRPRLGVARPVRPERVVPLPLLRVGEDLVGLVDLLEALGGGLVTRVLVGVVLPGELPVRLLDGLGVGGLRDAEGLVVVLVGDGHEGILAGEATPAQASAGSGSPARRRRSSSPWSVSRIFSTSAARRRTSFFAPRRARTRS